MAWYSPYLFPITTTIRYMPHFNDSRAHNCKTVVCMYVLYVMWHHNEVQSSPICSKLGHEVVGHILLKITYNKCILQSATNHHFQPVNNNLLYATIYHKFCLWLLQLDFNSLSDFYIGFIDLSLTFCRNSFCRSHNIGNN